MYSSKLCRDRYSMNAMVLLPYPSYFASEFQLFYPSRVIPICHFGLPCSCPHIPIVHSWIPAFPVISHVRVTPTAASSIALMNKESSPLCAALIA